MAKTSKHAQPYSPEFRAEAIWLARTSVARRSYVERALHHKSATPASVGCCLPAEPIGRNARARRQAAVPRVWRRSQKQDACWREALCGEASPEANQATGDGSGPRNAWWHAETAVILRRLALRWFCPNRHAHRCFPPGAHRAGNDSVGMHASSPVGECRRRIPRMGISRTSSSGDCPSVLVQCRVAHHVQPPAVPRARHRQHRCVGAYHSPTGAGRCRRLSRSYATAILDHNFVQFSTGERYVGN